MQINSLSKNFSTPLIDHSKIASNPSIFSQDTLQQHAAASSSSESLFHVIWNAICHFLRTIFCCSCSTKGVSIELTRLKDEDYKNIKIPTRVDLHKNNEKMDTYFIIGVTPSINQMTIFEMHYDEKNPELLEECTQLFQKTSDRLNVPIFMKIKKISDYKILKQLGFEISNIAEETDEDLMKLNEEEKTRALLSEYDYIKLIDKGLANLLKEKRVLSLEDPFIQAALDVLEQCRYTLSSVLEAIGLEELNNAWQDCIQTPYRVSYSKEKHMQFKMQSIGEEKYLKGRTSFPFDFWMEHNKLQQ